MHQNCVLCGDKKVAGADVLENQDKVDCRQIGHLTTNKAQAMELAKKVKRTNFAHATVLAENIVTSETSLNGINQTNDSTKHHDLLNQERTVNLSILATFDFTYSAEGIKKLTTTIPWWSRPRRYWIVVRVFRSQNCERILSRMLAVVRH